MVRALRRPSRRIWKFRTMSSTLRGCSPIPPRPRRRARGYTPATRGSAPRRPGGGGGTRVGGRPGARAGTSTAGADPPGSSAPRRGPPARRAVVRPARRNRAKGRRGKREELCGASPTLEPEVKGGGGGTCEGGGEGFAGGGSHSHSNYGGHGPARIVLMRTSQARRRNRAKAGAAREKSVASPTSAGWR